jgi:hypothetical protein
VRGAQRVLDDRDGLPEGVLGLERTLDGDVTVTLAEMSGTSARLDPRWATGWTVLIDTVGAGSQESATFDATLSADSAVILGRS